MTIDTIVAISTPPGRGAIGVVRVSGPATRRLVTAVAGTLPPPRHARHVSFRDADALLLDDGIAIFCPAPRSYTGEDLAELHGHGNPVLLNALVAALCALGARPARPGEFTERAYLNGRLDLAQAEAVADLIASQSARAARASLRTLRGDFGAAVEVLVARIQQARALLEASIDFADELHARDLVARQNAERSALCADLETLLGRAAQGARLAAGANIAIVGAPNVGKSSLLNRLAGSERAIVSALPGTTRDLVDADIVIGDIPLRIVDTAGLRATDDPIELEGIRRAEAARAVADVVLQVTDDPPGSKLPVLDIPPGAVLVVVHNKCDLHERTPQRTCAAGVVHVELSALTGAGVDLLVDALREALDVGAEDESDFSARARHVEALRRARAALADIDEALLAEAPEIAAEHYRAATLALESIGGRYGAEELLGDIFARFCIGK